MSFKFQLPPVTDSMTMPQLKSYLMQMVDQLEYALNNVDEGNLTEEAKKTILQTAGKQTEVSVEEATTVLRDMIIKNAEIVRNEMDEMSQELHGEYEAISSEFGSYQVETDAKITTNATNITSQYSQLQTLGSSIDTLSANKEDKSTVSSLSGTVGTQSTWINKTDAYIKTGLLFYEGLTPVYGVAISQNIQTYQVGNEEAMYQKGMYATFTADELAFYKDNVKVAYVANDDLYINVARVTNKLLIGNFELIDEGENGFTIR